MPEVETGPQSPPAPRSDGTSQRQGWWVAPVIFAASLTGVLLEVFEPTGVAWRHIAWEVVAPGAWLASIALQQWFRDWLADVHYRRGPLLGVIAVVLVAALLGYGKWFFTHLPPEAQERFTEVIFGRPVIVRMVNVAPPIGSLPLPPDLQPKNSEPAPPQPPEPTSASIDERIAAFDRFLDRLDERLAGGSVTSGNASNRDEPRIRVGGASQQDSTNEPRDPITITLGPVPSSCSDIGRVPYGGRDGGERNLLNRAAAVEQDFSELMSRLVAGARTSPGNEGTAREALRNWTGERLQDVFLAFGAPGRVDLNNTPVSDEILKQLEDVPFSGDSRQVVSRAATYLSCMKAIEANIRARVQ